MAETASQGRENSLCDLSDLSVRSSGISHAKVATDAKGSGGTEFQPEWVFACQSPGTAAISVWSYGSSAIGFAGKISHLTERCQSWAAEIRLRHPDFYWL